MPLSPAVTPLHIAKQAGEASLTPAQQSFNDLLAQIADQRAILAAWNQAIDAYHQRHAKDVAPLLDRYYAAHADLVNALVEASARKGLGRTLLRDLHAVIARLARDLADNLRDPATREAMQALHAQYAQEKPPDVPDTPDALQIAAPGGPESPEDIVRRVEEEMQARQARAQKERERHHASRARKPSAQQRQQQEAAQEASQSVRSVYRKLASALHPDREPDDAERQRKTALMQRVNLAYAANSLLDLLQLQLEVEQIDAQHMAAVGDAHLQRYNQVLTDQLAELRQEVVTLENTMRLQLGLASKRKLQPGQLMAQQRSQIKVLEHDIPLLQREVQAVADNDYLKQWLKAQAEGLLDAD
ncbi:J domain-containing protein [Acidovorax sp.]|uniref:J domain-containing protein n=1 Tax=Acidovorax sp. TaxID=1872122 RepID=UPI002ACE952E|nr:J domain-containing protein [Acidovorax sp.]MDZ7866112.1 J domain-containing protein [Acidovorax sp.]